MSVRQKYEDLKIDHRCTVADVLTSLTHDLKGTALLGYELCPTIIEADKEGINMAELKRSCNTCKLLRIN